MIPIVAIIGHQNVGKSTLFNLLTRTNDALVASFPGLTRDRRYGCAEVAGNKFICIDTSSIDGAKDGVKMYTEEQSLLAIEEADVVLFMVDAQSGLMPADYIIAKHLRLHKKLTLLIANKTDGINVDQAISDFWSLGLGRIYPISASHGRGVASLLETVLLPFIHKIYLTEEVGHATHWLQFKDNQKMGDDWSRNKLNLQNILIKLAIVGRPNVGKSTLTNRILGEKRVVVYDTPGTTRDSIYIPVQHNEHKYMLIDTAGVRKRSKITNIIEKYSVLKTLQAIESANVVLLVIDANQSISNQDLSLLTFILKSGRSLVIAVNKWDDLNSAAKEQIKKIIDYRLGFINFTRVHFISALHGRGIDNLFESVYETYNSSTCHQNATLLTNIMHMAAEDYQPPLVRGRRVKFKYAHAGGYNPLIIVIHGNLVNHLPGSYKRYLINCFCKALGIIGTPIRIQFKEGQNPFTIKHNTITLHCMYKRNRLINNFKKK